ncbi:MAG: hypothetical protein H6837_08655 [Planctomycetes bacterium]|nr:hypothetical protein [Planctomycetota bacterium]
MFRPLAAVLLAGSLAAQDVEGDYLVAATARPTTAAQGGLFLVNALAGTVSLLSSANGLDRSYSIAPDPYDRTLSYVGTSAASTALAPAVLRVVAAGRQVLQVSTLQLGLTAADRTVYQLQVLGLDLLFLTDTRLVLAPLAGGPPRTVIAFANQTEATNFACDGRRIYLHMQPTVNILADHVLEVDIESPSSRRLVYQAAGITDLVTAVSLDGAGNLLISENEAFSGVANLRHVDMTGKLLRSFKLPFDYGSAGARMDPAGTTILAGGRRFDTVQNRVVSGFVTILNWQLFKQEFGTSPESYGAIALRRHVDLLRSGHACLGSSNWRADIGSSGGLPSQGNSAYQLELTGKATARAMLLVGVHGAVQRPFPLAVMGAGTCELGLLPIAQVGATIPGSGRLVLPAPIPSAIGVVNIDIQWLIADPSANTAGFVSSQVGSIAIR